MSSKDKENKPSSTSALHQKLQDEKSADDVGLLDHPSYIELQSKLNEAEEKAAQSFDKMLRMQAENENALRRVERDISNAHKYALEKFTLELLPVIDSLERAITVGSSEDPVLQGVEMTLKMLNSSLEKFNIQQIDPLNQPFNPEFHQAVSAQVDTDARPNTVLSVLQKGYLLNGRLVRPALVVVSKGS